MSREDIFDVPDNIAPVLITDEDGRIYYNGTRAAFTRFDRSYIAAAASAFEKGRDIAIIYPSPPTHVQIPALLAIGFQARGPSPPALFVSNRSGIREQYFNLGIGPKFQPVDSVDPEPLGHFTAPMVKTGDGNRLSYITGHKPRNWNPDDPTSASLIHSTFGKKLATTLPNDLPLSGFILDFTTSLLDDRDTQESYQYLSQERDIPRIMIFDSPNHPYLERLEQANRDQSSDESVVFWGWSANSLVESPRKLLEPVAEDTSPRRSSSITDGGSIPSPFTDTFETLNNIRNGIERSIVRVPHGKLESVAREAYRQIGEAARFPGSVDDKYSGEGADAMGSAYFLYMYLDTLPTSVDFHDSMSALEDMNTWGTSNTLRGKVERLRSRVDAVERDVPGSGPMLEDACEALEEMVDVLTGHNPKADAIVEQIRDAVENDLEITVMTATRKQESLLRSFIAERTELSRGDTLSERVEFHSLYAPHTIPDADVLLFPGVPSRSHYPAIQSGVAPEQRYLTYPWETNRLTGRIEDVVETADWRTGPAIQHNAANELQLGTESLSEYVRLEEPRKPEPRPWWRSDSEGDESDDESVIKGESTSKARSIPESRRVGVSVDESTGNLVIDLDSLSPADPDEFWGAELEFDDGTERETIDEGRTDTPTTTGSDGGETEALRIDFVGGDYMYEEPRGLVWALQDTGEHSGVARTRKAVASLDRGDRLLLIEDDSRRDVFEHIVEKIHSECRGKFQRYLTMLDLWTTGIDRVVEYWREVQRIENERTPALPDLVMSMSDMAKFIAEDLEAYASEYDEPDATRGKQAVYHWLDNTTLGPSSPIPIRALGELYDVEVFKSHNEEIFAGLEEVRSLHVRVGNKLGKIVYSAHDADADEWLLKDCGLRISDVQDATVVKTVEGVSAETEEVSVRTLGKLRQGGD